MQLKIKDLFVSSHAFGKISNVKSVTLSLRVNAEYHEAKIAWNEYHLKKL